MEWVEITGRTVQEAKDRALDQLGVAEDDAEFEVLDEPRAGLFGRVRGEARVRARVRPTQPRPKAERRDRRKRGDVAVADVELTTSAQETESSASGSTSPPVRAPRKSAKGAATAASVSLAEGDAPVRTPRPPRAPRAPRLANNGSDRPQAEDNKQESDVDPQQVGEEAQRFVQGLVEAFGLGGVTTLRRDGDDLEVSVDGADLGLLVGPRGMTLQAVQELTRVAAQHRLGDHDTRLRVDVAGYRERRREALTRFAMQVASEVLGAGEARVLEPMSSADRKVIHDVLSEVDGLVTRSEGDDPQRRVVIAPANA
jgi:spoIIIJ-associated protein